MVVFTVSRVCGTRLVELIRFSIRYIIRLLNAVGWLSESAEWRGPVGVIVWMGVEKQPSDITFCRADTVFYTVYNTLAQCPDTFEVYLQVVAN